MAFRDSRPLPDGWVQQFDHNHQRAYWVDTKATPARSIWTHPLDDPEYQASQRAPSWGPPAGPPPPPQENSGNSGYPVSQPSPSLAPPVPYATSSAPQEQSNPFANPTSGGGDNKKGLDSFVGGAAAGGMFGKIMSKVEGKMGGQNSQPQYQYQQSPPPQQGYAAQPAYGQPQQQPMYGQQQQQPMYAAQPAYQQPVMVAPEKKKKGLGGMNPALMLGGGLLGGALLGSALSAGGGHHHHEDEDEYDDDY